jgi:putative redox protein
MGTRRAVLRHEGGMRFSGLTGTGRAIVFGDDPAANENSPVEIVAAALAACTAMDVISIMEKKRQAVESYTVSVVAAQRDEYPQVLTTIELLHEVVGPSVTEHAVSRSIELSATKYCPVNAMLSAGDTTVHHRYRVQRIGEKPLEASGEVIVTGPYRRPDVVASVASPQRAGDGTAGATK